MNGEYRFYCSCAGWPQHDVYSGLVPMIDDSRAISRRTFLQHVDRDDLRILAESLGYAAHPSQGLVMAADFAVGYRRSRLHGQRVYYLTHSSIEYVFVRPRSHARGSSSSAHAREAAAIA